MILLFVDNSNEILFLKVFYFFFVCFLIISFFLRSIPPFSWVWRITKLLLLGVFITLVANFTKKSIKNWWND